MLSTRFAYCFLIVLLLFIMPGYCLDVSVSTAQAGIQREPFDVGQNVIYNVHLEGVENPMRYTVEMSVGPNDMESVVSKSFSANINANPNSSGSSNTAQFQVNFQSTDLRRGEFGSWLNDQNQTEVWDKAWYKIKVTSLNPFEKPFEKEDYTGMPALVKVREEFKDPQVTPKKGTNANRFEYQVSVFSTVQDNITLEVGPTRNGPWTPAGVQYYTTPGSWQILKWPNVTLDFDFTSAAYRISGRREKVFDGPSWPIEVEFQNNSLSPEWGPFDMPFNYSIDIMAAKPIDVELNVWDVGNKRYNSAGRLKYSSPDQWERLEWKDVKTTSVTDAAGESKYYYSFYYEGSESPISTTYEKTGKYYSGPVLSVIGLNNWTVMPKNGTLFSPYTYSVQVLTRLPSCDIVLQTAPPGSDMWLDKGAITYSGANNTLVWRNIGFDPNNEEVGNASYRFIWGDTVLGEFIGPNIDVAQRNITWNPIKGTDRFDYKVEVRSSRPLLTIELVYTDDGMVWERSNLTQKYESAASEWKELIWKNQPWHKTIRFDVMRE
jgi:hypothetical protein